MARTIPLPKADTLAEGARTMVFIEGRGIVLFNVGGTIHAIDNTCPHQGSSLFTGKLEGTTLWCPAHGLKFDITAGCKSGDDRLKVTTFPVSREEGQWSITLPD